VSLRKEKVSSSSGEKEASGEKETKEKSSKKKSSSSSSSTKKSSSSKTAATTSSAAAATGDVFTVKVEIRVSSISNVGAGAQLVQLRAAKSKATRKAWAQTAPGGVSASKRDVVFKGDVMSFHTHLARTAAEPVAFDKKPCHLILYDVTNGAAAVRLARVETDLGALYAANTAANEWSDTLHLTLEPSKEKKASSDKPAAAADKPADGEKKRSRLELQVRFTPVKMNHRRLTLVDESNEAEAAHGTTTSVGNDDYMVASEESESLEASEAATEDDPEEEEGAAAAADEKSSDKADKSDKSDKSDKPEKKHSSSHSSSSSDARVKELEASLAAKEKELTAVREKMQKELATARTVMAELQDQADANHTAKELTDAKKYTAELEAEVAKLADAQTRTAELEQLSNELLAKLRTAQERSDDLEKQLASAKSAKSAAAAGDNVDFVAATARITELEQQVKAEKERAATLEKKIVDATAAAEKKASEAIAAAEKKAAEAEKKAAEADKKAAEKVAEAEKKAADKFVEAEKKAVAAAEKKSAEAVAAAEKKAAEAEQKSAEKVAAASAASAAASAASAASSDKDKESKKKSTARIEELEKALEAEQARAAELEKKVEKKKSRDAKEAKEASAHAEELEKQLAAEREQVTALKAQVEAASSKSKKKDKSADDATARVAELEQQLAAADKKAVDAAAAADKKIAEATAAAEKKAAEATAAAVKKVSAELGPKSTADDATQRIATLEKKLAEQTALVAAAAADKAAAVDATAQVRVAQARITELEGAAEKSSKREREREEAYKKDVVELKRTSALQRNELEAKLASTASDASSAMDEASERARGFEQQLAALELSRSELKAVTDQQRSALEAKLAAAEELRATTARAQSEAEDRVRDLEAQVTSLEHKRTELSETVERTAARSKSLEQQLTAAETEREGEVGKELAELRARVHTLEDGEASSSAKFNEVAVRCETLEDELADAEAKLKAKILKLKDTEEQVEALSGELDESNAKMVAVKKRVAELETKSEELANQLDEAKSKLASAEEQLAASGAALKEAQALAADWEAKHGKVAADLQERDEELQQSMIDKEEAEKKVESLTSQLADRDVASRGDADEMAERLTAATDAAAEAKHRVADLEAIVAKRDSKIAALERDVTELTEEVDELQADVDEHKERAAERAKAADEDADKESEAQEELSAAKKATKAAEAKVRELETELAELREQAASAKSALSQRITKLESDVEEARASPAPVTRTRSITQGSPMGRGSLASSDANVPPSDVQAYADRLEQERDELESELAAARAQISRFETQHANNAVAGGDGAASSTAAAASSAAAAAAGGDDKRAALLFENEVLTFLETQVYQAQQVFVSNSECAQLASRVFYQLTLWKAFDGNATPAARQTLPRTLTALRTYCELASGDRRGAAHCISALASLRGLIRQLAQQNKVGANVALPSHVLEFLVGVERVLNRAYRRYTQRLLALIKPLIIPAMLQKRRRQAKGLPSVEHDSTGTRDIVQHLDDAVRELEAEHVPVILSAQIAAAAFQYIAHHVCNAVLGEQKPPSYATPHNGFQIKLEASTLDEWSTRQSDKLGDAFGKCRDALGPALELATALVMDKSVLADASALREICPSLNYRQVLALVNNYNPDDNLGAAEPVPKNVAVALLKLAQAEEKKQQGASLPVLFDSERVFDPVLP
jgi:DNA repair exonuclease SbcCD ATPase subunit